MIASQKQTGSQYVVKRQCSTVVTIASVVNEANDNERRIVKSFLINKRAKVVNVLNRNDGLVLLSIYSMLLDKIFFFTFCFIFPSIYYTMNFYFICLKIKKTFIPVTYFSIRLTLVNCIKIYVVIRHVFILLFIT